MNDFSKAVQVPSLVLVVLLFSASIWAQITAQTGAIRGTVTDSSGAVVANATLTLTSSRGATTTTQTSADGSFTFPLLEPGQYKLSANAPSFQPQAMDNVEVQITQITTVPVRLQPGNDTTEISVTAELPVVNTTNATTGQVLTAEEISRLPLPTRNFTGLLALNPGTSSNLPDATALGRGSSTVFVNGQRGTNNNLVINGIDANNIGNNNFNGVPIPAPDTLEEFRVQTSLYDASQGKTSGGNINAITKGGNAHYHGELFEFFRNEDLNANNWFFNHTNTPRPILKQNQFGGSFGGPVPKIARTYFFGSYQETRQINGVSGSISARFPVLPAVRSRANIESAFGLTAGSLDPVALNLLNAPGQFGGFLIPSAVGTPGRFGQLNASAPARFTQRQFNANGDHEFSDTHRLSLRYFRANDELFDPLGGEGAGNLGSGQNSPLTNHLASISDTYSFSPRLINEARFGFSRISSVTAGKDPATLASIGITRFNSSIFSGIPLFTTLDINPAFGGISTNNDQASTNNTYNLSDTVSYTFGKHSLRLGGEYRRYQLNLFNNFASRGFLQFNSFNDILLGNVNNTAFVGTGITSRNFRGRDIAGYAQDDWKVTSRLTLNVGVRYDYLGPFVDTQDRVGNFDPSLVPASALASGGPGLLNGFILPSSANFPSSGITGTPGVDRSVLTKLNKTNFAPRVGFAYDVFGDSKTSVRGGYGVYYVRTSNQTLLQLITAAPFFALSNVTNPGFVLSNPFPALPLPSQFPRFPTPAQFTGFNAAGTPQFAGGPFITVNPIQRNASTPYAEHYNLSFEHEFPGQLGFELGYLGSQGVHLLFSRNINQATLASPTNPINGLTANSSRNVLARVPVVGFTQSGLLAVTDAGHSNFNAFVASLNRHTEKMFIQASYTWSKSFDNNSGSVTQDLGGTTGNQIDTRDDRGLSNFDRTHVIKVTYRYSFPAFRNANSLVHNTIAGWEIGGVTTYQSANPIGFGCSNCTTTSVFGIGGRPFVVGNLNNLIAGGDAASHIGDPGQTGFFNPGLLAPATSLPAGTTIGALNLFGGAGNQSFTVGGFGPAANNSGAFFGNLGRNPGFRGPFQQEWDMYLSKSFPVHEAIGLTFRAEAFNVFNHAVFSAPNATVGSANFGIISSTVTSPRVLQLALKLNF